MIYHTFSVVSENQFVAFRAAFTPRIVAFLVVPLILRFVFSILLLWLRAAAIHPWHVWLFIIS